MNTCKSTGDLFGESQGASSTTTNNNNNKSSKNCKSETGNSNKKNNKNKLKTPNRLAVASSNCIGIKSCNLLTVNKSPSSTALLAATTPTGKQAQFNEAAASRQMSSSNKIKSIAQDMKTIFVGKGNSKSSSSSLNAQQSISADGSSSGPTTPSGSSSAATAIGATSSGFSSTSSSQQQSTRLVGAPVTPADIAGVTQAVVDSWMQTFDAVLSHKVGLDLFRQFLRSEFSEENIEFWIACENYRSVPESQVDDMAREIFENFVTELAPKEINLDAGTRIQCAQLMSAPNRDTFAQAQRRIRALMERDSYQRFLQSSVFQNFVKQNSKSIQR